MKYFVLMFTITLLSLTLWNHDNHKYVRPTADQLSANMFIPAPSEKKPEVEPKKETPKKEAPKKNMIWSLTGVTNRQYTPIP